VVRCSVAHSFTKIERATARYALQRQYLHVIIIINMQVRSPYTLPYIQYIKPRTYTSQHASAIRQCDLNYTQWRNAHICVHFVTLCLKHSKLPQRQTYSNQLFNDHYLSNIRVPSSVHIALCPWTVRVSLPWRNATKTERNNWPALCKFQTSNIREF
jgi:hypothetical protein